MSITSTIRANSSGLSARFRALTSALLLLTLFTACNTASGDDEEEEREPKRILLEIEHVGNAEQTYLDAQGKPVTLALAPGVYSVRAPGPSDFALFSPGEAASAELEALAETGDPMPMLAALMASDTSKSAGLTGDQANADYEESPILPGAKSVLPITFEEGDVLELAMMLGPSNDTFLGTVKPIDLSSLEEGVWQFGPEDLGWWDAGTEVNEPLGRGSNQPAAAPGVDSGEPEDGGVVSVATHGDEAAGIALPPIEGVLRVTVTIP